MPLAERLDCTALNIFLLVFFFAGLLVIAAVNRRPRETSSPTSCPATPPLAKLIVKPPRPQKNKFLEQLRRAEKGEAPAASRAPKVRWARGTPPSDAKASPKASDPNSKDEAPLIATADLRRQGNAGIATSSAAPVWAAT